MKKIDLFGNARNIIMKLCLSLAMLCTLLPNSLSFIHATDSSNAGLVNIAQGSEITVPGSGAVTPTSNMVDGDPNTIWASDTGTWPTTVNIKLPEGKLKPVKKVVVRFEKNQPNWSVDARLGYYQNTITSEINLTNKTNHSFNNAIEYVSEDGVSMTNLLITLSNPKNAGAEGKFWPAIAEVEIYVDEDAEETDYVNLASNATISSVGGSYGNPGNLVDDNYKSLYGFYNGGMSGLVGKECWVQLDLKENYNVNALEIAFENLDPDSNGFVFHYSLYGMSAEDSEWKPLVKNATATRKNNDNIKKHILDPNGGTLSLRKVKIVIDDIEKTGGDPWPAIAEFKIFGLGKDVEDTENIAWKKPVHTNTNQANGSKVTDGNKTTNWSGTYYPGYADIDLEDNYTLDEIEVYLPTNGYSQYDIYTSMDGRDFTKLHSKTNTDATPESGDVIDAGQVEARIVRVYVNYQSTSANAILNEVRMKGTKSGTAKEETPAVDIVDYDDSEYNIDVTPEMAIEEVKGIVSRQLGEQYIDWFQFTLADNPKGNDYDYYELENGDNGKVHITGNDGVSLATGLNYYLKYYLHVNISQVGNQVKMPSTSVSVDKKVFKETKLPVRYAYNYCTLSYSMAFWGEKEWRNELDWLALNGVNTVLDATAQEEVWRRFLTDIGYTPAEAKDYISGPAYYAWSYMANMAGYGGPVHDSWFTDRTDLARKNQLTMRKLGMQPILQGYSGMVPIDIETKDAETSGNVIAQGTWCSFTRPSMLKTTSDVFKKYAQNFYKAQKEVYGDVSDFYATDPFHEGGITGGLDMTDVSRIVLDEMIKADDQSVWVIQSWQGNPTNAILNGIADRKDNALILDLYAEKEPRWETWAGGEFGNTPWVYCMLNNFGGRLGLYGHIDNFVNGVPKALNQAKNMKGLGITPEASVNNPVLYDLFFETIWADDGDNVQPIDTEKWFKDYTTRRYGAESDAAYQAMEILNDTVYKPELNMKGQGAPESVVNARPALDISAASTWGNAIVDYNKEDLEKAAKLLLQDFDILKDSEGYRYDLANVLEQVLSNSAQEYQRAMTRAYQSQDLDQFKALSDKFLSLIDMVEKVTGTQEKFLVGTWIEQAKDLAKNADDFTKELYEFNARSLITTWGSINQANGGGLKDYSNRQWAGLTKDYYKPRWERWIGERIKDLEGKTGQNFNSNDWFAMEWQWVNENNEYTAESNGLDLSILGSDVLKNYSVTSIPKDPAEDDSKDLPVDGMIATAGSEQSQTGDEGPAGNLLDNNTSSLWHSVWSGTARENLWVDIALDEETIIDGLRYLPRQSGSNGNITGYRVDVKGASGEYQTIATGTWKNSSAWKVLTFAEPIKAKNVRLYATASVSDSSAKNYASGAELRLTHPVATEDTTLVKEILGKAIAKAQAISKEDMAKLAPTVQVMIKDALAAANDVMNNEAATNEQCVEAWLNLANALHYADFKADKTELKALIDICNKLNEEDYSAGFDAMIIALDEAKVVYNDGNALQTRINKAHSALLNALNALVKNEDTSKDYLAKLVAMFDEIDSTKYCKNEAWTAFVNAMDDALAVLANNDATASQINTALRALTSAYEDIRLLPDESVLGQLKAFLERVESLDLNNYTKENAARFMATASKVRMMINDVNTFDPAITEEIAGINKAIDNEQIVTPSDQTPGVNEPTNPEGSATPQAPAETQTPKTNVNGTTKPGTTKTGDATNMMGMTVMLLASAGAVAGLRKKQKKNK